jgi:hypothetical protein
VRKQVSGRGKALYTSLTLTLSENIYRNPSLITTAASNDNQLPRRDMISDVVSRKTLCYFSFSNAPEDILSLKSDFELYDL